MEKQQKWAQLFEQVVGRKPTPQEFLAGKENGFDFKCIKSVAQMTVQSENSVASTVPSEEANKQETVVAPIPEAVAPIQPMVENVAKNQSKWKKIVLIASALVVVGLGAAYYYFDSITGVDVAVEEFTAAVNSNDYDTIAKLLSDKDMKWSKVEAQAFMEYLKDSKIDVTDELEQLAEAGGKNIYNDENGNKLLGFKVVEKLYGIFPKYQVETYPIDVKVKTNLETLMVNGKKIEKNKEFSLEQTKFAPTTFDVVAKTDLGDLKTKVATELTAAKNNKVLLSLATQIYRVETKFPSTLTNVSDVKLFVNGKVVANGLTKELNLMDNQEVELYATFKYEGAAYQTEKLKKVVGQDSKATISGEFKLSADVAKKIEEAKKAKESKEEEARKAEETKKKIQTFMNSYIASMRSSISGRSVQFSSYFDTNSSVYNEYARYIEDGGVSKANVNYQETLEYNVTDIRKDGENYVVTVHNRFKEVYMDGKSDVVTKDQVFTLRPNGDSYVITDVSET